MVYILRLDKGIRSGPSRSDYLCYHDIDGVEVILKQACRQ